MIKKMVYVVDESDAETVSKLFFQKTRLIMEAFLAMLQVHTESTKQSAEEIAGSYKTLHFISNALLFLVLLSGGYLIFIGDTPNVHYRASVKELESICDDSDQQSVEETRGKL